MKCDNCNEEIVKKSDYSRYSVAEMQFRTKIDRTQLKTIEVFLCEICAKEFCEVINGWYYQSSVYKKRVEEGKSS